MIVDIDIFVISVPKMMNQFLVIFPINVNRVVTNRANSFKNVCSTLNLIFKNLIQIVVHL